MNRVSFLRAAAILGFTPHVIEASTESVPTAVIPETKVKAVPDELVLEAETIQVTRWLPGYDVMGEVSGGQDGHVEVEVATADGRIYKFVAQDKNQTSVGARRLPYIRTRA